MAPELCKPKTLFTEYRLPPLLSTLPAWMFTAPLPPKWLPWVLLKAFLTAAERVFSAKMVPAWLSKLSAVRRMSRLAEISPWWLLSLPVLMRVSWACITPPVLDTLLALMSATPLAAATVPLMAWLFLSTTAASVSLSKSPLKAKVTLLLLEPIWPEVLLRSAPTMLTCLLAVTLPAWLLMLFCALMSTLLPADRFPASLFKVWAVNTALFLAYTSPLLRTLSVKFKVTLFAVTMACWVFWLVRLLSSALAAINKSVSAAR